MCLTSICLREANEVRETDVRYKGGNVYTRDSPALHRRSRFDWSPLGEALVVHQPIFERNSAQRSTREAELLEA